MPRYLNLQLLNTIQVVIVALLVMPMPSNKVRGMVQGTINKFWHSQEYVKKTSERHWQQAASDSRIQAVGSGTI